MSAPAPGSIPNELECEVFVRLQLKVDGGEFRCRVPRGRRCRRVLWQQGRGESRLLPIGGHRPLDADGFGRRQVRRNCALTNGTTARDLTLGQPERMQAENFFDLTHGQPFLRQPCPPLFSGGPGSRSRGWSWPLWPLTWPPPL